MEWPATPGLAGRESGSVPGLTERDASIHQERMNKDDSARTQGGGMVRFKRNRGTIGMVDSNAIRSRKMIIGRNRIVGALFCMGMVVGGFARPASAAYLIDYEGDVLPEQDGWLSIGTPDDSSIFTRTNFNGVFTIDVVPNGSLMMASYLRSCNLESKAVRCEWRSGISMDKWALADFGLVFEGEGIRDEVGMEINDSAARLIVYPMSGGPRYYETNVLLNSSGIHDYRIDVVNNVVALYVDGTSQLVVDLGHVIGNEFSIQASYGNGGDGYPGRYELDYLRVYTIPEPSSLFIAAAGIQLVSFSKPTASGRGPEEVRPFRCI